MSKYKAGDKIKVVSSERESYWYSDKIGQEFTLLGVDKTHGPFIKESEYYGRSFFSECDIELVCANKQLVQEKEMKSEAFNLKTKDWFIRVNNKEEFEAAKEWVKSKGCSFTFCEGWNSDIIAIEAESGKCLRIFSDSFIHRDAKEIKLTFKTVVDSVEYPAVKSEQQKKVEELEATIAQAQTQLVQLKQQINKGE